MLWKGVEVSEVGIIRLAKIWALNRRSIGCAGVDWLVLGVLPHGYTACVSGLVGELLHVGKVIHRRLTIVVHIKAVE